MSSPKRLLTVRLCFSLACALVAWSASHAQVWTGAVSSTWTNPANWTNGVVPNGSSAIATFDEGAASVTLLSDVTVNALDFSGTGVSHAIDVENGRTLTLNGTGILGPTSNASQLITNLSPGSSIVFLGAATISRPNPAATVTLANNGTLTFADTSSAGSATIASQGSGRVDFTDTSSAGSATITGVANFADNSSAGSAAITDASGTFTGNSNAGSATITIQGSGRFDFSGNSSAGSATIAIQGQGTLVFSNDSTAGLAAITNQKYLDFGGNASAGQSTIVNASSGIINFGDNSSAGEAVITNQGSLSLFGFATAGTATILNEGTLYFSQSSTGANAAVTNATTGNLAVNASQFSLGSLAGSGSVYLYSPGTFEVGSLNTDTTYSGSLGGSGISFIKAGTGTLTLEGDAGSLRGLTDVQAGTLQFARTSAYYGSQTDSSWAAFLSVQAGATAAFNVGGAGEFNSQELLTLGNYASFAAGSFLGVDTTNAAGGNFTLSGSLTGALGLRKLGPGTLTLAGTNTATGTTTISGGTLQLGNGGSTGSLAGNIVNNAALAFNRSDAVTFAEVISGSGSLTKSGAGTLTLSGANTYTGTTTVSTGTLRLAGSARLSDTARLSVGSGGTFDLNGLTDTVGSLDGAGSVALGNGTLAAGADDSSTTFSGVISGAGSLTKAGAGTLTLSGANTFSGATTIDAGTLALGHSSALQNSTLSVSPGGTFSFGSLHAATLGGLTGDQALALTNGSSGVALTVGSGGASSSYGGVLSGTGSLIKTGAGTFTLSGANTYSGPTTINAGVLEFTGDTYLHLDGVLSGDIVLNNGGTLRLARNFTFGSWAYTSTPAITINPGGLVTNTGTTNTLANLTLAGGTLEANGGATPGFPAYFLRGTVTATGATASQITAPGATNALHQIQVGDNTAGGTTTFNVSHAAGLLTISASIEDGINLAGTAPTPGGLVKTGPGTLVLSGANSYSAGTTLSGGTLGLGSSGALGPAGPIAFAGGTLRFSSVNTTDYSSRFSSAADQAYALNTNGQSVTLASALTSENGTLTKTGAGTLTLTGNNTYAGTTTVSEGTLQIGAGGTSGSIAGNIVNNAALVLNRSDNVIYGGVISGSGSVTKNGAGRWTLTNADSYTGTTTINAGTLEFGGDTFLHLNGVLAGDITVNNGGTLFFNRNLAFGGFAVTSTPAITVNAGGLLTNGGAFNTLVDLTLAGGTLEARGGAGPGYHSYHLKGTVTASGAVPSHITGPGDINSFHQVQLGDHTAGGTTTFHVADAAGSLVIAAPLIDGLNLAATAYTASGLVKTGAGTLTLSGANTYSGGTTISGGTLVGNTTSLQGAITNHAALTFNQAGDGAYGGIISGSGSITKTGAGALTLSGANTYSGGTTISGGTLQIGAGSTTGSIAGNITNHAALAFNRSDALTYAGVISGSGSLTQAGTNTLILTADNTNTGTATISAGTLQLGNGGTTGSWAGPIINNAAVAFSRSDAFTHANTITGSGRLTQAGTGVLTLSGSSSYTGGTTLSAGTLVLGSSAAIGSSGTITFGGGTLAFSAANTTDYSSRFSSAAGQAYKLDTNGQSVTLATALTSSGGTLTKCGSGTLTLSGANTYSGDTTVTGGTLVLGHALALQNSHVVVSGGALSFGTLTAATLGGASGDVTLTNTNSAGVTLSLGNGTTDLSSGANLGGAGGFAKTGTSTVTLSGASTYTGATTVTAGTLAAASHTAFGSGTLVLNGGTIQASGGGITLPNAVNLTAASTLGGSQALTLSGAVTLNGFNALNVTNTASTTLGGGIAESTPSILIKQGGGELQLTGAGTYTGGTFIQAGSVRINNNTGSAFGSGAVTVASGATLTGSGSFTGALQLNGTYSPGNSPGQQDTGSQTWAPGAGYVWEINDTIGTAGTNWDQVAITGSLTLAATSANPFILELTSLTLGNVAGLAANFDDTADYAFTFVTTTAGITGFAADKFAIDTTGFTNPFTGSWSVALANGGNALALNYTGAAAIPEPSTYAMIAGLLMFAIVAARRRRR